MAKQQTIIKLINLIGYLLLVMGVLIMLLIAGVVTQGFGITVYQVQLFGAVTSGFFMMVLGLLLVLLTLTLKVDDKSS